MASTNHQPAGNPANVAALERLFIEWSKTGGRVPSWEFLAAHGCLAVDSLTEEQLGLLGTTREALHRLAAGEAEFPPSRPGSWNAPTGEQTPPPKIL
jgi:hypothetical protein